MTSLKYYILDVFTSEPYKGNPLSVVWCEQDLALYQYHAIAREFGYSETSFVNYSSVDKAFRVRSFTPGDFEVAGAGHNLLGCRGQRGAG
jgi:PhzF family phenazine biosynthesis protein